MAVQLTEAWWKANRPKTLTTKELDKAFEALEAAKHTDNGRKNLYKLAVPGALEDLLKAVDVVDERANKVAHAQTKKNFVELRAAVKKEKSDREHAQATLVGATKQMKTDASALLKMLQDDVTGNVVALGALASQKVAKGAAPDAVRAEMQADVTALVQLMASAKALLTRIEKIAAATNDLPIEGHGIIARFLTSMEGINGAFGIVAKAIAAGKFEILPKVAEAELKPAMGKLREYIQEW